MKALILLGVISIGISSWYVGEAFEKGFTAGHQKATETITKACANKGYFKVGILTYQCQQLFVVDDQEQEQ